MSESPHPGLRVRFDGPVGTVTLCDPDHRNAQTPSFWLALAGVARDIPPETRVVVLDAEGPSFSAGLNRGLLRPGGIPGEPDLLEVAARGSQETADLIEPYQAAFSAWWGLPAVVVAAVQGHALGAGFQLALAADLRVVADDVQFGMRETQLGMVPDLGGTGTLLRLVGYSRALEICATGRSVGAAEAVSIGLATVAVPAADLPAATADLVSALLAVDAAALRAVKQLLHDGTSRSRTEQLRAEREAQGRLLHGLATGHGG